MPLAPELRVMPEMIATFYRSGLITELVSGVIKGETDRDLVNDARRLLDELLMKSLIEVIGLENIPKEGGCMMVFCHPNIDVLLPALLNLIVELYDETGQQVVMAMGSEIPMTTENFNDKSAVPGSVTLLRRFHRMYANNIISVPTAENRKDYYTGRVTAARQIMRQLSRNNIVMLSPEGHVEIDNVISPEGSYHEGSGRLAMVATAHGIPMVPVGVFVEEGVIVANIGKLFFVKSDRGEDAVNEMMEQVALQMPPELRGPYADTIAT